MIAIERRKPTASLAEWPEDLHPVLAQVLSRRNVAAPKELELTLQHLVPVGRFDALQAGVDLLLEHRERNVIIVGDFDADGATSTALMVLALRELGFTRVNYFIPDRFALGYGLSPGAVEALGQYDGGLIVTVDNGISSVDGVAAARARGFRVLITDHHLPPEELPSADVIVNPNVPGASFPGKNLAGVGVAFYLVAALGRALGEPGTAANYLDLVALGTVADLVSMDHMNRILVEQGLMRIRAGRCKVGLLALCEAAGINYRTVVASSMGYQLGPRLNAAGRLDDMSLGVRCLISDSRDEAKKIAAELDALNRERREIEAKMKSEALTLVDELGDEITGELRASICLLRDDWHEGVVGLIAGRIKERFHRPSFAFALTASGDLKGSGRSIAGFHLRDALAEIEAKNPGLIKRYGGHAMAAGLSIERGSFDTFKEALQAVSSARITAADLAQCVESDGDLKAEQMTLPVATMLRNAAPWGQGFPEPCFDGEFELLESRILKSAHLKMTLQPTDGGNAIEAIAFNRADSTWAVGRVRRIAYRLSVNDFFAQPRVQLVVDHIADDVVEGFGDEL
jgi:single-stranded-DNA-specific exonuclease